MMLYNFCVTDVVCVLQVLLVHETTSLNVMTGLNKSKLRVILKNWTEGRHIVRNKTLNKYN